MENGDRAGSSQPNSDASRRNGWHTVGEWLRTIVIALVIALPIRWFIAEPFVVSGASMDPTFASGQFLIVDRLTYRFEEPERGDVIVFEYPNNPSEYYIKRIIGLPGETVRVAEGTVTVENSEHPEGIVLTEPYVDAAHAARDTFSKKLGESEYFVMGDNRRQSSDSRVWGPLRRDHIVGRPIVRLFPVASAIFLPGEYDQP